MSDITIRAKSSIKMLVASQKRSIDWLFAKGEPVGIVVLRLLQEIDSHGDESELLDLLDKINEIFGNTQ